MLNTDEANVVKALIREAAGKELRGLVRVMSDASFRGNIKELIQGFNVQVAHAVSLENIAEKI